MQQPGPFESCPKGDLCRTRIRIPGQAAKGRTLLLCMSARHRRELQGSLGPGVLLVSCPLEVLGILEVSSAPRVILDRCEACRSCCRHALTQLEMRLELLGSVHPYPSAVLPGTEPSGSGRYRLSPSERFREASHYLELVSKGNVSLAALASLSGVTTRQITRLFRQANQESPMRQIRRMRLSPAPGFRWTLDSGIISR